MTVWGYLNAKENLKNANMNRKATKVGNQGEKATEKLLNENFGADPNLHIFHDLHIPARNNTNFEQANVDHVIITKNFGILIDTKSWKPGKYKTKRNGKTYRDKQPFPNADTNTLDMAADRYTNYLKTRNCEPLTWVAITAIWPTTNKHTSIWRIHHKPTTPNLKTATHVKATHLPNLIKAITHNEPPPPPGTTNAIIALLRKPTPR